MSLDRSPEVLARNLPLDLDHAVNGGGCDRIVPVLLLAIRVEKGDGSLAEMMPADARHERGAVDTGR